MKLYIDPGTGSMLFAILIGALGAFYYLVRTWIVKLRFLLSGGKKTAEDGGSHGLVVFADDKRYWSVFQPVLSELSRRGKDVFYMTASPDDPGLECDLPHFQAQFIGQGNKAFARLNFLKADMVLSTTPGLDVYQWKRSPDVKYYLHLLHASAEVAGYRMFGLDYYDGVLLSGQYQLEDLRELEEIRELPQKDAPLIGIPYMDEMAKRLKDAPKAEKEGITVLLAPSWGPSAIFSKLGGSIIEALLNTGYHVIVRPHPQSFTSEKAMMDELTEKYPASEQLEWNRDVDNFQVLNRADIMISDFSGVVFDFSLVYDKPVIYANSEFDKSPYDYWWMKRPFWTASALPRLGQELKPENLGKLKEIIDACLNDPRFAEGRRQVREETWVHPGEGAVRAADFIEKKCAELKKQEKDV